ncbi:MAG TPA: ParB/RepB/Spo0J family partition protein [Candidatus Eisenbacteria bacterium]|nr:ParB/RepB/Spo0J family partition protein [Candidatus Eisenbacteria bacterium]
MQRRQRTVLTMVPLSAVTPNPDQPRKHFAEDALAELAASIRARGLLQPIVVRRSEAAGFQLLAGERRFRAAQLAGLDRVPALIREGDDTLEVALIENLQREDLSPLEEAEALALLIERHDYSHRDVADLLGKSRPYVSNTLALNRLPESVKADLHREGRSISRELLMGIARQETSEAAEALWRRIQLAAVSVRKFRAEKTGKATDRPVLRDVFLAARRFNRALRRLAMEGDPQLELPPEIVRVLRRSERLIQRRLRAISSMSKGIKASL